MLSNYTYSVGTPICQDHFGWTADEIVSKFGIIMSVNGGLAFLCFFIIAPLARRYDTMMSYHLISNKAMINISFILGKSNLIRYFDFARFDERVLLISFGVVTAIVGRAAFFPFPGVDNPAVCVGVPNNCTIKLDEVWGGQPILSDDLPICEVISSPLEHQNHGKFVS